MGTAAVVAGMSAALSAGTCDPQIVAVEARRSCEPNGAAVGSGPIQGEKMARSEREAPSLAGYDELLTIAGAP